MSLLRKLQNYSPKRDPTQSPITQMVAKLLAGADLLMTGPTDVNFVDWLVTSLFDAKSPNESLSNKTL